MRLFDQVRRYGLRTHDPMMEVLQAEFSAMASAAHVVDVTNVQNYLQDTNQLTRDPFDAASAVPPFPVTFFEFWTGHTGPMKGSRIGVLIATWDRWKDPDAKETLIPEWVRDPRDDWMFKGRNVDLSSARWWLWGLEVSSGGAYLSRTDVHGPSASFSIRLAEDGTVMRLGDNEPAAGANFGEISNRPDIETGTELGTARWFDICWGGLKFALTPCFFATSLMQCRNVRIDANEPDPKLSRAFHRRAGVPLTKYYTISIGPISDRSAGQGAAVSDKSSRPLHICRGHFAEYTEDKPLFGKYSGRFWVPAHVRGSAEAGTVVKDYRVVPPTHGGVSA